MKFNEKFKKLEAEVAEYKDTIDLLNENVKEEINQDVEQQQQNDNEVELKGENETKPSYSIKQS